MVITKLKLVDVQMQILLADLMKRAHDPSLYDGPEAFDGVGMNGSHDILPSCMIAVYSTADSPSTDRLPKS